MGIAWFIGVDEEDAPKTWNDLLDPKWYNQIIMTDPSQASTTKYWMAAMMQSPKYGPDFFQKLKDNGVELESGTTATHNRVADASYQVGICLDYAQLQMQSLTLPEGILPEGYRETAPAPGIGVVLCRIESSQVQGWQ